MRALVAAAVLFSSAAAAADPDYVAAVERWRAEHEQGIRAEDGWLAVAGLFWLDEGVSRMGSLPESDIVLPAGAPAFAGTIERSGRKFVLHVAPGVDARDGGRPLSTKELAPDTSGVRDVVTLGRLSFYVIERNARFGLRLRDPDNPTRKAFKGLTWYPVDEKLRIEARYVAHPRPKTILVPNVLGDVVPMPSPGRVVFRAGGKRLTLDAILEDPSSTELFFLFSDGTTEKTTYGGGRFLYTELPKNGKVVLDFNKAESPPCAFTAFATCPLPPKQNRLRVAIEAGETASH